MSADAQDAAQRTIGLESAPSPSTDDEQGSEAVTDAEIEEIERDAHSTGPIGRPAHWWKDTARRLLAEIEQAIADEHPELDRGEVFELVQEWLRLEDDRKH